MRAARSALPRWIASGLALLALASQPAHALFEDDEARKAILDLRMRVQQSDEAQRKLAEQQNTVVQEQIAPLRRSLLDLNAQIESLRAEIAKLRGTNEQLARDLAEAQRRLTDQAQGFDARLRVLEPQKVILDGREFQASPEERRAHDAAMAMVRRGDFAEAVAAFQAFDNRFPDSGYGDSVRFWLGNAQYGKRDYKDAIATFRSFIAGSPNHARAGEAMLALANCQIELKDVKGAKRSLEGLIKAYPGSEAAQAGKERLAALK